MRPRLVRRFVSMASKAMPRLWTSPKPVARNGTSRSPSAPAVAARDSCGRPRVAWRTEQERADEGDEGARREHQEPDHQRARLLGADAEHLLLGGLHLRGSGMSADLEIGDIVDAARDVSAIEAVKQLVLADVVVAQLQGPPAAARDDASPRDDGDAGAGEGREILERRLHRGKGAHADQGAGDVAEIVEDRVDHDVPDPLAV